MDDRRDDGPSVTGRLGGAKKGGASDEALGRSRGGLTTKLHLVCDGNGLPLAVHVTAGQRAESAEFEAVCALVDAPRRPRRLLADRGYDAKRIRAWLREHVTLVTRRIGPDPLHKVQFTLNKRGFAAWLHFGEKEMLSALAREGIDLLHKRLIEGPRHEP